MSCVRTHRSIESLVAAALALSAAFVLAAPALAQPCDSCAGVQVIRIDITSGADQSKLEQLAQTFGRDFELWPESATPDTIQARVAPAAQPALTASGLKYEVLIADLQLYQEQEALAAQGRDFFSAIRTYDEHVQFIDSLVAAYPSLAQKIDLGASVQGRHMWGLHITGQGRVKPGIYYFGSEHGNEKAGASIVAYVANNLLSHYGSDPHITALVDHAEWFLIPIANPDGYVANNRTNSHGVDINRNWGGPGHGSNPFSEPETQHLRDLMVNNPQIRVLVDIHGYVNLLMWPWGYTSQLCADDALFRTVTTTCRAKIAAAGGGNYDIGPIYTTIYPAPGCSTDYCYGIHHIWAWGWEVTNSTMPNICLQFLDALQYLGDWIWSYDCNGNDHPDTDDLASGRSHDLNHNGVPDECDGLGDVNCDGYLNFDDINPFVLALSDPAGYIQAYPNCPLLKRDINGDGQVNFDDINPFVSLLTGI